MRKHEELESVEDRMEKAAISIAKFRHAEHMALIAAANSPVTGGAALVGDLRSKAIKADLAYFSTGKLRPFVLKMLRNEEVF